MTKTYCGSMDREAAGLYWYRGFDVVRNGSSWDIVAGVARDDKGTKVATRKTRNAAGNFIDRRVFNETKKLKAVRGW